MPLEYLYRAANQESSKALFMIHGYGSSAEDLFQFAPHLPDDYHIFSFRAPYQLSASQYAWYAIHFDEDQKKFNDLNQARESLGHLKTSIDQLKHTYALNQVTLMGFSQGCILGLALTLNHPNYFTAILGLSGYLNKELLLLTPPQPSNTQFFLSHGTADAVIPFQWAQESMEYLKAHDMEVSWHTYPSGHTVSYDNFKDLMDFIGGL